VTCLDLSRVWKQEQRGPTFRRVTEILLNLWHTKNNRWERKKVYMVHQNSQVFENGKYGRKIRTDRKSGTSTLFVPIKEAWMDGAHVWLQFLVKTLIHYLASSRTRSTHANQPIKLCLCFASRTKLEMNKQPVPSCETRWILWSRKSIEHSLINRRLLHMLVSCCLEELSGFVFF
jgi:hypothetical protein